MAFDYLGNVRIKKRHNTDFSVPLKPKKTMDARIYRALIGPKPKKVLNSGKVRTESKDMHCNVGDAQAVKVSGSPWHINGNPERSTVNKKQKISSKEVSMLELGESPSRGGDLLMKPLFDGLKGENPNQNLLENEKSPLEASAMMVSPHARELLPKSSVERTEILLSTTAMEGRSFTKSEEGKREKTRALEDKRHVSNTDSDSFAKKHCLRADPLHNSADLRKLTEMHTAFSNSLGLPMSGSEASNGTKDIPVAHKEDRTNDFHESSKLVEDVDDNDHVMTGKEHLIEPSSLMKHKRDHEESPVISEQHSYLQSKKQRIEFSCPNQQFLENKCSCDQSLCQLSIRTDFHVGASMAMIILQEKKFESMPAEEEELEEGEIRELRGEIKKMEGEAMQELGERTELEEGEIRESPCGSSSSFLQISIDQAESSDLEQVNSEPKQPEGDIVQLLAIRENPCRNSCSLLQVSMEQAKDSDLEQANVDPKQREGDIVRSAAVRESPRWNSCSFQQISMEQIEALDLGKTNIEANQPMSENVQSADLAAGKFLENVDATSALIRQVDETHCRREEEICKRQQKEIAEFDKLKQELEENLRKKHISAPTFQKKMNELDVHIRKCLRKLKYKHWLVKQKEKCIKDSWLEEAKTETLSKSFDELPLTETGFCFKSVMVDYDQDGISDDLQEAVQVSKLVLESQNVDKVSLETAESVDLAGRLLTCPVVQHNENDVVDNFSLGKEALTDTLLCNQELNLEGAVLASSQLNDVELPTSALLPKDAERGSQFPSQEGQGPNAEHNQPPTSHGELDNMEISRVQAEPASQAQQIENESAAMVNELPQGIEEPNSSHKTEELMQLPTGGLSSQIDTLACPEISEVQPEGTSAGPERVGAASPDCSSQPVQMNSMTNFWPSAAFYNDPLLVECERIRRQKESHTAKHKEQMDQFKHEREKEIEEVNKKYSNLIQNVELMYHEMQNSFDMIYEKILMNRHLAQAYKYMNGDSSTVIQGMPSASSQQHPPQPSAPQNTERPVQAPAPVRPPQIVHHTSELFSRDPAAYSYRPTAGPAHNFQVGTQLRSTGPHLRSSMPPNVIARQNQLLTSLFTSHPRSNVAISQPQLTQVAPARFGYRPMSGSVNETRLVERPEILQCDLSATQLNLQLNANATNRPLTAGLDPRVFPNRQGITCVRPASMDTTGLSMVNDVIDISDD